MKKKKKQQQDLPVKTAEFHARPFSSLKQVTVAEATVAKPVEVPTKLPAKAVQMEDSDLFLQAMDGVRKLQGQPEPAKKDITGIKQKLPPENIQKPTVEVDPGEREAFSQAIGRLKLDVTFTDSIPDEDELKPLAINRLRQLKRGVINIDRQLDLHGLTRDEALAALAPFLRNAMTHAEKAALIITGKGNNSTGEPVLHQAVTGWLREQGKEYVLEFAPAPREMGGSGAFVVFLRGIVIGDNIR